MPAFTPAVDEHDSPLLALATLVGRVEAHCDALKLRVKDAFRIFDANGDGRISSSGQIRGEWMRFTFNRGQCQPFGYWRLHILSRKTPQLHILVLSGEALADSQLVSCTGREQGRQKQKQKNHWHRFSAEKNKNTGRQVLQNKEHNRAYSR
jgi:hypothetical protein